MEKIKDVIYERIKWAFFVPLLVTRARLGVFFGERKGNLSDIQGDTRGYRFLEPLLFATTSQFANQV